MKIVFSFCWICNFFSFFEEKPFIPVAQEVLSYEEIKKDDKVVGYMIRSKCLNCGTVNNLFSLERKEVIDYDERTDFNNDS